MQSIIQNLHIDVQHYYREGNTVADALAKHGGSMEDQPIANIFSSVQEIPQKARGAYLMDTCQMPNFRVRHTKIH